MASPEEGRLPEANQALSRIFGGASHVRNVFIRMGSIRPRHRSGRAHRERSGFEGPWTQDPLKFNNSYFVELLKGDSKGMLKLHTDTVLVEDPEFRKYVILKAQDEEAFFRDYAVSHKRLLELGFTPLSSVNLALKKTMITGVVAVTVVFLNYFYVWIELDAAAIVALLSSDRHGSRLTRITIIRIRLLIRDLQVRISHIHREGNRLADYMALVIGFRR